MSVKSTAAAQSHSYVDQAYLFATFVRDGAVSLYNRASIPGEIQKRSLSFVRSTVGLASIYTCPWFAGGGALIASIAPDRVKVGITWTEGMVSGLWNRMTFKQRVIASTVGVTITVAGFGILNIPAAIFATKLGAELALKNLAKETIAEVTRAAEEQLNEPAQDTNIVPTRVRQRSSTVVGTNPVRV